MDVKVAFDPPGELTDADGNPLEPTESWLRDGLWADFYRDGLRVGTKGASHLETSLCHDQRSGKVMLNFDAGGGTGRSSELGHFDDSGLPVWRPDCLPRPFTPWRSSVSWITTRWTW